MTDNIVMKHWVHKYFIVEKIWPRKGANNNIGNLVLQYFSL